MACGLRQGFDATETADHERTRSQLHRIDSPEFLERPPYNAATDFIDANVARGCTGKVAFIDPTRALTYGELQAATCRFGRGLLALGLRPERRLALLLSDTVDFPIVFWGAIRAGIIPVPINVLLTSEQIAYVLGDCRADAIVLSPSLLGIVAPLVGRPRTIRMVIVADREDQTAARVGSAMPAVQTHRLADVLARGTPEPWTAPTVSDEVAFWLYSSGSTGAPKGVKHVHSSLIATARLAGVGVLGITSDDVMFSAAKLPFAYGLGNSLSFPMSVGASAVLVPERLSPDIVLDVMRRHRPSIFCAVPSLYAALLAHAAIGPGAGSDRLRLCVSAAEPLPAHIGERWKKIVGVDILDSIGSTEMLQMFICNRPGLVRYGTSGEPVPGYEARIVGEDGRTLGDEEIGELVIRGPSAAEGYWNQRAKTRRTFVGEWTYTGDKYRRDRGGYYHYCGRADDMFKVNGYWVSPFDVEAALMSHEAVLEAAVVGRKDVDGLVKPKAFVVLRHGCEPDASLFDALKTHAKTRAGAWAYPRWIDLRTELPKTATGKIQRFKLREEEEQRGTELGFNVAGRHIEAQWHGPPPDHTPTLVLLHEGLGSVAAWKEFPHRLAERTGYGVLVYSRPGYGHSDPVPLPRPLTYMHDEAREVLPAVLDQARIRKAILVGHSDGASIAAIHAGTVQDFRVRGLVLIAPHFFVEDTGLRSIEATRLAYQSGDLRNRLAKYHGDVDAAFWGWNQAWLDPAFRCWRIDEHLPYIRVPILVVQGRDDAHGTLAQVETAKRETYCPVEVALLDGAGHTPQVDRPEETLEAISEFVRRVLVVHEGLSPAA